MQCEIVVLHVQSKVRKLIPAMQRLHDACQYFVKLFSLFPARFAVRVAFLSRPVVFCKCKMIVRCRGLCGKPLADVPFSC